MSYSLAYTFSCQKDSINCLAFSADGLYLASGSDDCTVSVHDCVRGIEVQKLVGDAPVTALLWHANGAGGEKLFIGYGNGKLRFIDILSAVPDGIQFPVNGDFPIEGLDHDTTSGMLAVCTTREVRLWQQHRASYPIRGNWTSPPSRTPPMP
ncbi:WD40-repeat-containing domain protein [Fomitopsis serialis]|uniref:WD40-repeat-containing domain protein n=1 Tax=Fomitopsis serialis TaxID=139415 RepID=UPI00200863FE|nr:WD40-repeat-containing domain protein [Neoantrodia serialis]KAH9917203.1 WD40-repeat-containing domain protein [Neoantrodia serialis]